MKKITLGTNYRDVLTGFFGVATGRAEYITGCEQILIQPPAVEGKDFIEGRWFDVDRLEAFGSNTFAHAAGVVLARTAAAFGADKPAPTK